MNLSKAKKRYYVAFSLCMALYMIGMIGISLIHKYYDFSTYIIFGLTLVPIAALLMAIAENWRFINSLDEYLRARQIKAVMVGLAFMLAISASWGILEAVLDVPHLASLYFTVIFCVGYGLTEIFYNNRDKTND